MALQIVCDASEYAQESGRRQRPRESNLRHYRTETLTHNSLALTGQDPTRRVDELGRRSRKRTYTYVLRSMRTLRFTLVARAGQLARIGGRQVLRLTFNPATAALYTRLEQHLAA